MADEQEHQQASSRFRLPRLFSHAPEAVSQGAVNGNNSNDNRPDSREATTQFASGGMDARSGNAVDMSPVSTEELVALREAVEELSGQVTQVNNRETSLEKVFDTLHAELADYKKDFLYEHLKPVVRPLLFLFDSLEQFDGEVAIAQASMSENPAGSVLSPKVVRQNVHFFRDQLAEALQVCEVTIMETPSGPFNAKLHRAVDVAVVPREDDGTIVRVVRSGWYLNGQLLRPAEVVVGKFRG